jgi:stage IV sporulation protein FB
MLIEPAESPYDLRFELFGTPVRVNPWFWLAAVILGWDFLVNLGFVSLFLWVVCVFLSILLHEFGHVWAGKLFGSDGYIVLHGFGGLAVGASDLATRWKRVVVYLAGPCIQLAVFAVVFYVAPEKSLNELWERYYLESSRSMLFYIMLWEINLFWPLINLAPIWPLDGGKVARELCTWLSPRQGMRWSLIVSIGAGAVLAVNSLVAMNRGVPLIPYVPAGGWYMALFFGLLAVESYLLLTQLRQMQPWRYEEPDDRLPWER